MGLISTLGCGTLSGLKSMATWFVGKIFGVITGGFLSAELATIGLLGIAGIILFLYELKKHAVGLILLTALIFGAPLIFC